MVEWLDRWAQLPGYFFYSWRYPQSASLGFLQMGLAIRRRHKLLNVHWRNHLEQTRKAQQLWTAQTAGQDQDPGADERLVVLGAGCLYDLDLAALSRRYSTILLVDGNPLVKSAWRKAKRAYAGRTVIDFQINEISGALISWRRELAAALRSAPRNRAAWSSALSAVKNTDTALLKHSLALPAAYDKPSAVISLNILSQIPLLWQDCLEAILVRRFGKRWVNEHQTEWFEAFYPSAKMLVAQHLSSIAQAAPNDILLITDLEYAYYTAGREFRAKDYAEPPFVWKTGEGIQTNGSWQVSQSGTEDFAAASCHVLSALYGINLEDLSTASNFFPCYASTALPCWLWHIRPLGTENDKQGIIHRVGAFFLRRIEN